MDRFRWIVLIFILLLIGYQEYNLSSEHQSKPTTNTPVVETKPQPQYQLQFVDIPKYRKIQENTIYGDVLSRSISDPYKSDIRSTTVHETAHSINSQLRNKHFATHKSINGFYALNGKGIILEDPNFNIRDISKFIPENLRSYRYDLYFIRQLKDWDDMPTYILEEFVCYTIGGASALEDYKNGLRGEEQFDSVSGCLDFSIYAIATYIATKKLDPDYIENHPEFKATIEYFLKIAEKTFLEGKDIFTSQRQSELYKQLLNSESDIKKCLIEEFNGAFIK